MTNLHDPFTEEVIREIDPDLVAIPAISKFLIERKIIVHIWEVHSAGSSGDRSDAPYSFRIVN